MYFRLNPECYFIQGAKRGAIFDLIEGEAYTLSSYETDLIALCEKNNPVDNDEKIFRELKRCRLGNFYSKAPFLPKLRVGSPYKDVPLNNPPEFYRAFIEINNSCNRDCWFCGYFGTKRSSGCIGCNKWKDGGELLPLERWMTLIDELRDLECRDLFITGGDLTLVWDKTLRLLDYADTKFKNIYLIMHKQSMSKRILKDVSSKAKLIIQTENLDDPPIGDIILWTVGSKGPERKSGSTLNENVVIDFTIEDASHLAKDLPIMSKIIDAHMYPFLNNMKYHPCLGHTLTICYNGNVTPCPMIRNHILGNVRDTFLYTIFEEGMDEVNKYWNLTLDKLEKCTDCEFRYACNDCRALEENLTGRLDGKKLCRYDPKEGK
ncbi:MAG: SPASM domain-containing protein [Methanothrix sp.]|nr:MAG: SPASM domain-containing protein [Methanothrix sp.]